jgi:S1-C subfamily serine protease
MKGERAARLAAGLAVCAVLLPAAARGDDLSAVYARVERSVVFIECTTQSGQFSGSGFIVASNGAYTAVVTAGHVVAGAQKIKVLVGRGRRHHYNAAVIAADDVRDVAVLRIRATGLPALRLAAPQTLQVGETVAILGYPRDGDFYVESGDVLQPEMHAGIISAIRLRGSIVQFDAASDYGDSGGPVVDAAGRVVAVESGAWSDFFDEQLPGSSFAASSAAVGEVLRNLGHPRAASANDNLQRLKEVSQAHRDVWDRVAEILLGTLAIEVILFLALLPAIGRVVTKAGYSVCWMLWSLVPGVNLIMLYAFAFSRWPLQRRSIQH